MMTYLLSDVICQTFLTAVGKWQTKTPNEKAMKVSISTDIDHAKEDGYRHVEIVIYGPLNYVQVWTRTKWTVIPLEDLVDDGQGDTVIAKGKDYVTGTSEWKLLADHDSGWRDGVREVLTKNEKTLHTFENRNSQWYEVVEVASLKLPEK